jgi:2'-5' RNA ligase
VSARRRAFVAVVPPASVRQWSEDVVESLRADGHGLRWMPVGQRHLTLQFLGRVDDDAPLVAALAGMGATVAPFTLGLAGGGAFPSPRRASVLWLGVQQGSDELAALATALTGATAPLGFEPEDRPYRAHLTLARANRGRDVRALVDQLDAAAPSPRWTVDSVVLFESDTRADGAVHTEVARVRLTG